MVRVGGIVRYLLPPQVPMGDSTDRTVESPTVRNSIYRTGKRCQAEQSRAKIARWVPFHRRRSLLQVPSQAGPLANVEAKVADVNSCSAAAGLVGIGQLVVTVPP